MKTTLVIIMAITFNLASSQEVMRFKTTSFNTYTGYDGVPDIVNTYSGYLKTYWEIDNINKVVRRYWDKNFTKQMGEDIDNSDGVVTIQIGYGSTSIDLKSYTMSSIGKYEIKSFIVKKTL